MTRNTLKTLAIALSASAMTFAMPAQAAELSTAGFTNIVTTSSHVAPAWGDQSVEHKRKHKRKHRGHGHGRHDRYDRYERGDRYERSDYRTYGEPVYRDTRVWQDRDGRYHCRKKDGTTGLLIGAGVGALVGHEVAGRGNDRTLGAILGAAGGALLGRTIDRASSPRCR